MEREYREVQITGSGNAGVIGNNNRVHVVSLGADAWRNPHKDRTAHRIGLIVIVAFAVAVLAYLLPVDPATLATTTALLRSMLIALCSGLAPIAAAYLIWRWRD